MSDKAIPILDHPVKPDDDSRMDEIAAPSLQDGSQ
jgi:hypothetical protein